MHVEDCVLHSSSHKSNILHVPLLMVFFGDFVAYLLLHQLILMAVKIAAARMLTRTCDMRYALRLLCVACPQL